MIIVTSTLPKSFVFKAISVHTTPKKFKDAAITGQFGFVFKETSIGKAHNYHDVNVFEKLRFRDGLVWTVGSTVEIKLCFQILPV